MEEIKVGEIFTIGEEDDEEQEVEVLAAINIEGTQYVAVGFVEDLAEETDEDIDVFFLRVDSEGDFEAIESDDEFDKVSKAFDEILEDE
ncbi:DUF1292 domain-containing protein [Ureibacillus manganicus]|uniref:Cyclopropane-fatty-acyl-phospholipid synthase n=1 Tax=Ureibacillus manganicus DSM 26584 TaxID=1384049 RepID=A0A0A3I6F9_9BACL|nr:DUF1292 domain-containing protein [Ureibacillus manganicus]KGR80289.1 cyclopropane-fatty-acyl-phospholipid synthase [Ureibacillus manganicus DSM 26584]